MSVDVVSCPQNQSSSQIMQEEAPVAERFCRRATRAAMHAVRWVGSWFSCGSGDSKPAKRYQIGLAVKVLFVSLLIAGGMFNLPSRPTNRLQPFESRPIDPARRDRMTREFRDLARLLRVENPDRLSIAPVTGASTVIMENGQMTVSEEHENSLVGQGPYTTGQVRGIFAHEIGHIAMDHLRRRREYRLEQEHDRFLHGPHDSFRDDAETAARVADERRAVQQRIAEFEQNQELEADRFVAERNPELGQRLHDALVQMEQTDPYVAQDFDTHPPTAVRVERIRDLMRRTAPAQNPNT